MESTIEAEVKKDDSLRGRNPTATTLKFEIIKYPPDQIYWEQYYQLCITGIVILSPKIKMTLGQLMEQV